MKLEYILLQAEGAEEGGGGQGIQQIIMFGLIGLVFYFFMLRPQIKRSKEAIWFFGNGSVTITKLTKRIT
mgnify:CR=1 FL=1